jgi:hypothetical protein
MRILTMLPQDDLVEVPAVARAAKAPGDDGLVTSENRNDPFLALGVAAEIPDEVVRLFAAVGTHRNLAREIERRFGGGADAVALSGGNGVRQDIPPDLIQDIRRIPSPFTEFATRW